MSEERIYKAIVWMKDDGPGQRVTVSAQSLADARQKLEDIYGKGHIYDLHNEEDAEKPRGA